MIVGLEKRLKLIAADLVEHFERRLEVVDGKAMVVCMSRRICMDLHDRIVALRPEWFHEDDDKDMLKVVMTGNISEGLRYALYARSRQRREALAKRFRGPDDHFKIVIVRDMWLTGFDAPSLHAMYLDKPMRGHGLMQTIARENRVFRDEPGGLVVDYLGIADDLRAALATCTESGGTGTTAISQDEAVAIMQEKYEVCLGLFHGFDWSLWGSGSATERLSLLPDAQEHILAQPDGKKRLLAAVTGLSQTFALAVPHERALAIRDDVGFFQAVRAALVKQRTEGKQPLEDLEHAIRQIIFKAIVTDEVIDVFAAAGLKKPDISILSDEFLAEVQSMPQRNLAVELLHKLLTGEIKTRERRNVVQARSFAELLEKTIRKYQNRAIETAQVIEELISIAREMREAQARGQELGLSDDELAFYDALAANESAVRELSEETLKKIAHELTDQVRRSATIDWALRESVRANMRVMAKRLLRKYKYPPDQQEAAVDLVIEQAEALTAEWVE